jgi:hypothetical protein
MNMQSEPNSFTHEKERQIKEKRHVNVKKQGAKKKQNQMNYLDIIH